MGSLRGDLQLELIRLLPQITAKLIAIFMMENLERFFSVPRLSFYFVLVIISTLVAVSAYRSVGARGQEILLKLYDLAWIVVAIIGVAVTYSQLGIGVSKALKEESRSKIEGLLNGIRTIDSENLVRLNCVMSQSTVLPLPLIWSRNWTDSSEIPDPNCVWAFGLRRAELELLVSNNAISASCSSSRYFPWQEKYTLFNNDSYGLPTPCSYLEYSPSVCVEAYCKRERAIGFIHNALIDPLMGAKTSKRFDQELDRFRAAGESMDVIRSANLVPIKPYDLIITLLFVCIALGLRLAKGIIELWRVFK